MAWRITFGWQSVKKNETRGFQKNELTLEGSHEEERRKRMFQYIAERDAWYESGTPPPSKPPKWSMQQYLEYVEKFIENVTGVNRRPWQRP
jgi:hypothetical protein